MWSEGHWVFTKVVSMVRLGQKPDFNKIKDEWKWRIRDFFFLRERTISTSSANK